MLHGDTVVQCAMGASITEVYNLESENRNGSCHFGKLAACTNGTLLKVGNDWKQMSGVTVLFHFLSSSKETHTLFSAVIGLP